MILKAGVAVLKPDFDPEQPYSQEFLITHPERICSSYGKTKMELYYTKGGKGKTGTIGKSGPAQDGIVVARKSSKCASAVCGPLRDGRALSVFMCFSSCDSCAHAWAPHYVCNHILDKNDEPLPWRYINNVKSLITEELCVFYIKDVLHLAESRRKGDLFPGPGL